MSVFVKKFFETHCTDHDYIGLLEYDRRISFFYVLIKLFFPLLLFVYLFLITKLLVIFNFRHEYYLCELNWLDLNIISSTQNFQPHAPRDFRLCLLTERMELFFKEN